MAEIVKMPKLSDTMTEGVVAQWLVKEGDSIKSGDILAEIETDKATMEFESFYDGTLLYVGVQKGEAAPVDSILAIIGKKGEDISSLIENTAPSSKNGAEKKEEAPNEKEESPSAKESKDAPEVQVDSKKESSGEKPESEKSQAPKNEKPEAIAQSSDGRIKASPLAKMMASEKGFNINEIQGSGDNGRITRKDVEEHTPRSKGGNYYSQGVPFTEEPVSQMRKVIAKRLAESKFSAPHFYLTMDIDMDQAIAARKFINDGGGAKISFNDMVIKAVAAALKKNPKVNSSWLGDKIRYNNEIHIGVAVAVPEGLLVPVVRHADKKGMSEIGAEVKEFAQKAKDKKLQPSDWEGNTFTISNLGMFGIEEFTAIINPPDACILAIGAIRSEPVVKNGAVVPGNKMKVTLSCDHRVVDGASGAAFLQDLQKNLENPVMMLV